jgi:hypothetical protein
LPTLLPFTTSSNQWDKVIPTPITFRNMIRHDVGEPDLIIPVIICDSCGEPIQDRGNVLAIGDDKLLFVHKPAQRQGCDQVRSPEGGWEELHTFLERLQYNFTHPILSPLEPWPPKKD